MSWNMMGTIEHDYSTPFIDKALNRSKKHPSKKGGSQYRQKKTFTANPLWRKAYTGRSEK